MFVGNVSGELYVIIGKERGQFFLLIGVEKYVVRRVLFLENTSRSVKRQSRAYVIHCSLMTHLIILNNYLPSLLNCYTVCKCDYINTFFSNFNYR
jgi:hypothetical protein